eukprot:365058-Chlamydomonas_euryale.AAC.6
MSAGGLGGCQTPPGTSRPMWMIALGFTLQVHPDQCGCLPLASHFSTFGPACVKIGVVPFITDESHGKCVDVAFSHTSVGTPPPAEVDETAG